MENREKGVVSLVLLIFLTILLVRSLDFPVRARLAPLVVGIPTWCLIFLQTLFDWFPHFERRFAAVHGESLFTGELASMALEQNESAGNLRKREGALFLWLMGLLLASYLFGLILATPLFAFAYLSLWSKERWSMAIVYSLVVWVIIYLLLVQLLQAQLPVPHLLDWWQ
jgi:Tripartite tricarboxylate transporter TctB family